MNSPRTLLIAACVLSAAAAASAVAAATGGAHLKVTSSIDGKTVLPQRIRWLAFPNLSRAKVAEVDFLIDGKVDWIEHRPPYTYSDDGGYLVTSWLAPGPHRFSVRVVSKDRRTATDTVVARVLSAPALPASLAGSWQRTIADTSAAPKPHSRANPFEAVTPTPPGTYTLTFDRRWIKDRFPGRYNPKDGHGWLLESDYTAGPNAFRVYGAVTFHVPDFSIADGGGWWCLPGGPRTDYEWSVTGNTLTLAPAGGKDACGIRGFIWTGEWMRAGRA